MPLTQTQKVHLQSLYAGQRKLFLAEKHPDAYARMQKERVLEAYLQDLGMEAMLAYVAMEEDMRAQAEAMIDPLERGRYIESIPLSIEEIIQAEILHAPL